MDYLSPSSLQNLLPINTPHDYRNTEAQKTKAMPVVVAPLPSPSLAFTTPERDPVKAALQTGAWHYPGVKALRPTLPQRPTTSQAVRLVPPQPPDPASRRFLRAARQNTGRCLPVK